MVVHICNTSVTHPTMDCPWRLENQALWTEFQPYHVRFYWEVICFGQLINSRFRIPVKGQLNLARIIEIFSNLEINSRILKTQNHQQKSGNDMQSDNKVVKFVDNKSDNKSEYVKVNHSQDDDSMYKNVIARLTDKKFQLFITYEVISGVNMVSFFLVFLSFRIFGYVWVIWCLSMNHPFKLITFYLISK